MFVVRIETEEVRKFRAFRRLRDAFAYARRSDDDAQDRASSVFDVADTDDAEIAVMAVRDGLGAPLAAREPDTAVMLASMGLGTGLRI